MEIGRRIAALRKEKHMTQEALGKAVGVSDRIVSKWETGSTMPSVELIPALASALGVTLDQLFDVEREARARRTGDGAEADDFAGLIRETVRAAVEDVLRDALKDAALDLVEDTVREAVDEAVSDAMRGASANTGRTMMILSKDKRWLVRFVGTAWINGPLTYNGVPDRFIIEISCADGRIHTVGDYASREDAEPDMKRILDAYIEGMAALSL